MTQVTIEELQEALIDGRIDILQFTEVLVDNFGIERTMEIIQHNLKIAIAKENEKPPESGSKSASDKLARKNMDTL